MQIYKQNSIFYKIVVFMLCALILFLSPCAKYLDVYHIEKVDAVGGTIVAEAGSIAWEWLLALLATLGLSTAAYENKEALMESYDEYLQAQIDTEMFIIDNVEEKCIQVYDKASDTVQNIPWNEYLDSIKGFHDVAVDNLTDVYIKLCPSLLGSYKDFITSVLNGDTYVEGFSTAIPQSFTKADIEKQNSGNEVTYSWMVHNIYSYNHPYQSNPVHYDYLYIRSGSTNVRVAGFNEIYTSTDSNGRSFTNYYHNVYRFDSIYGYLLFPQGGTLQSISDGKVNTQNISSSAGDSLSARDGSQKGDIYNVTSTFTANFPIFETNLEMQNYLRTGNGYENAINYTRSIYDNITDNNDLPTIGNFGRELWEVVANAQDWGIGSYGDGAIVNDWSDDLPYIGLDDLWEYANTRQDVFEKVIDDIINGVYDPTKDIPDTYDDAWKDVIDNGWDDVIDNLVNNPAKDPAKPIDPSIPVNPDIPGSIEMDIPIEDVVPTVESSFGDIAGSIRYKFPFSIPWDVRYLFVKLSSTPKVPRFELPIKIERRGIDEKIIVDLKDFQKISDLSRSMFSMIFLMQLIKLTMLVVGMRKEE